MREKLFIFLVLVILGGVLVALNAASYVSKPVEPDREIQANRSTYNAGATGTRAFFELLAETGRNPVRWQEKPAALLNGAPNKPQTFVIVGRTPREISETETQQILKWVAGGGRLVVIDRQPPKDLLATTANWTVAAVPENESSMDVDPANSPQMTEKVVAAKPLQPTVYTRGVVAAMPSRFASTAKLEFVGADDEIEVKTIESSDDRLPPRAVKTPSNVGSGGDGENGDPHLASRAEESIVEDEAAPNWQPPFVHVANAEKNILVDFSYGEGSIVYLSDPYIVSNGGIGLADNARLAINVVASSGGTIAFDEYHHGYGGESRLYGYFAETPLPALVAQLALLIGFVLISKSKRFARALPAAEPSRLAKLEYVSAMAELQHRARAYDLAVENIYAEFRRRAARSLGVDNSAASRKELAALVAERAKMRAEEVENLMSRAEDISYGATPKKTELLEIIRSLREIEEKLGLKRNRNARR